MELSGFSLYQGAYNHNLSSTSVKGIWDLNANYLWRFMAYPVKDYFYFTSFNSYNDLKKYLNSKNKNDKGGGTNLFNITKTSKTSFLVVPNPPSYSNTNFYYFGMIGLRLNEKYHLDGPEFVITFKKECNIKSYTFSFQFNKEKKTYKNFFNNYNNGYFILGEELFDDENKKSKILFTNAEKSEKGLSWFVKFNKIYTKINGKKKIIEFKAEKFGAEFIVNMPYLMGTEEYLSYINKTFFNELIDKKLCIFNKLNNKKILYSFICDGQSKNFINYLNDKFPDLIFEHKKLEENFILTKNDLFSFNNFNKSDTNLYFLILFHSANINKNYNNWTLGIPFLKKYRLSFNYDSKKIGYYNDYENIIKIEEQNNLILGNIFIKIIIIIILIIIIFTLGMLYQKKIIKIPRKNKANELDDNYEYNSYKNIHINDINNTNANIGENKKEVELGFKLVN